MSFYKIRADLARQWSQRTRAEYFGIFPHYALGTIADRNHTVRRDLSGLSLGQLTARLSRSTPASAWNWSAGPGVN